MSTDKNKLTEWSDYLMSNYLVSAARNSEYAFAITYMGKIESLPNWELFSWI